MISVSFSAIKDSLKDPDAQNRATRTMTALGWNDSASRIEWQNGAGVFGRLLLNGYPTAASVYTPTPDMALDRDWERTSLEGFRWCLSLRRDRLAWFDLQNGTRWKSDLGPAVALAVDGFTPQSFLSVGRFEPRVPSVAIEFGLGTDNPTQILSERIFQWWHDFLEDFGSPSDNTDAKSLFSRTVAAMLLVRTIEDLRVSPFLPHGRLADCATKLAKGDDHAFVGLVQELSLKFASRIFSDLPKYYYPRAPLCRLIADTYSIQVNFAGLDIDPVGQFYEEVLGVEYQRVGDGQYHLFHRGGKIVRDETARRQHGVYYTPRVYANLLARKLVRPLARIAETSDEIPIVVDLAVGSGELLCAALRELLEVPSWRNPLIVKNILDQKLFGLDINSSAAQLTALNLLRTAVRRVPELVTDHLPLPSLEKNLLTGNALSVKALSELPKADVALLNPPFHGKRKWDPGVPLADRLPILRRSVNLPNQAFAILLSAVHQAKDGASIGCVFPSQLLSGRESSTWREEIAKIVDIEALVENYANAFEGVQSYAGLLWGRRTRAKEKERSRARVVHISGAMKFHAVDLAAILASGTAARPHVRDCVRSPIEAGDADWTVATVERKPASVKSKVQIRELILDDTPHQAPVVAPKPWGRNLFLFDDSSMDGILQHKASPFKVRGTSSSFRRIAWPNYLMRTPVLFEPVVEGLRILLPGDGSKPVPLSDLQSDPVAHEAASTIRAVVQSRSASEVAPSGRRFVENMRKGLIGFHTPKGFRDDDSPLVVASRATRSEVGMSQGIGWSTWVNSDGSVVPVGGLWFRTRDEDIAFLLAAWMSLPVFAAAVAGTAPARNLGTTEPTLEDFADLTVPDPFSSKSRSRLSEFIEIAHGYRAVIETNLSPAAELADFKPVQTIASSLWEG